MKSFRGVIASLIFLLPILATVQPIEASDIHEDQKPDSKQLARLQKKLDHLRIPLSGLQLLLLDNPFKTGKKAGGSQYLALEEARGFGECLYFFSVQVDLQTGDPEKYKMYFNILGNPRYKEKVISPLTMRVLGAYGRKDKDYVQGTYVLQHEDLPPLRFHILAIEKQKSEKIGAGVAFYVLSGNSKQDSVQLSALCKEEYAITKEGKFVDEEGNLIKVEEDEKDEIKRWSSLEEVIGEQISQKKKVKEKPLKDNKRVFKREKKFLPETPSLSFQPPESGSSLPQAKSDISSSTSDAVKEKAPLPYRGVNYSLLRRETEALLRSLQEQEEVNEASPQASSSPSLISSKETTVSQEIPLPNSSNQILLEMEGDKIPFPLKEEAEILRSWIKRQQI